MTSSAYTFKHETKQIFILGIPIIATQVAQTAMGFVDTLMAGRYGDNDLAAIAIGFSVWMPILLALTGILMSTTPLVAQAFGGRQFQRISHTIQQALWLALLLGGFGSVLLWQVEPIFQFMSVAPEVAAISNEYLKALSWSLPAVTLFQVLRSSHEALHRTKPIMVISFIALACNIPLNYIFIYGKFGLPAMGGVGCGWATTIVLWIQLFALILYTYKSPDFSNINFWQHWKKPNLSRQREILWVGIPIGISIFIEASMFTVIALFLAPLGTQAVAAHQITISFTGLVFMIPLSLAMALTIRVGYALGTGKAARARFICKTALIVSIMIAALTATFVAVLSAQIASIYTINPAIKSVAINLLLLAAIFQFSDALQVNAAAALRGYKDTRISLLAIFFSYWLIGLPLGYSLALTQLWGQSYGPGGFWFGIIIGLTIAAALLVWRLSVVSRRHITKADAIA